MRERKDHFFGTTRAPRHVHELDLNTVVANPEQPRKHFDEERLRELATSIERHGLLQPIVVQKVNDSGTFMIVAGERRFRAHQLLNRPTIDAIIFEGKPNTDELALIENLQRENLGPIEEAEALAALQEKHGYDQGALAEVVGKARNTVNEILRLNDLAEEIKTECRAPDTLPKTVLIEIARAGSRDAQLALYKRVKAGTGTLKATRAAKAPRRAVSERARQTEVAQAITFGRGLAKRLESISDEYLAANQAEYATLMTLARQIAGRLEAARQAIGEPIEVRPEEPAQAE